MRGRGAAAVHAVAEEQVLGLGVVVVLGPFLDRMTASQFCAGSTWSPYCEMGGFATTAATAIRSTTEINLVPDMITVRKLLSDSNFRYFWTVTSVTSVTFAVTVAKLLCLNSC